MKIKKILRILMLIVLAPVGLLALLVAYYMLRSDKPLRELTAEECMKGREVAMLMGAIPFDTMNDPPKKGCPGYGEHIQRTFGLYRLGDIEFQIPRDYLWQGKYDEGKQDGLYLMIQHPSMKPYNMETKKAGWHDQIKITLEFIPPNPKRTSPLHVLFYGTRSGLDSLDYSPDDYTTTYPSPAYDAQIGMNYFLIDHKRAESNDAHKIYYTGNIDTPDTWYVCATNYPSNSCETYYRYRDNLWIDMAFSADLMPEYRDIKQKTNQLIKQFELTK